MIFPGWPTQFVKGGKNLLRAPKWSSRGSFLRPSYWFLNLCLCHCLCNLWFAIVMAKLYFPFWRESGYRSLWSLARKNRWRPFLMNLNCHETKSRRRRCSRIKGKRERLKKHRWSGSWQPCQNLQTLFKRDIIVTTSPRPKCGEALVAGRMA